MENRIVKLLYRSFDAPLKKKEQERLDRALKESGELRRLKTDILGLRRGIAEVAPRAFEPGFAGRVIDRIRAGAKPADNAETLIGACLASFKRVTAVALAILAALVLYNLAHNDFLPKDQMFYVSDLTIGQILRLPVF